MRDIGPHAAHADGVRSRLAALSARATAGGNAAAGTVPATVDDLATAAAAAVATTTAAVAAAIPISATALATAPESGAKHGETTEAKAAAAATTIEARIVTIGRITVPFVHIQAAASRPAGERPADSTQHATDESSRPVVVTRVGVGATRIARIAGSTRATATRVDLATAAVGKAHATTAAAGVAAASAKGRRGTGQAENQG